MLPQIDDIAQVADGDGPLLAHRPADARDEPAEVLFVLVQPAPLVTHLERLGVDLGDHPDRARNHRRLGLRAAHAAQAGGDEQPAFETLPGFQAQVDAPGVEQRDRRAVHDPLRADVHEASGGHLSVRGHAQGRHAIVVRPGAIVGNDHAVGQDESWGLRVRREQTQWMT
jgi:hypothetical protein